jgi:hypothetical protein
MGLNEAQERSVAIALERLEKTLALIDRLLDHPASGRMWQIALDLDDDHRTRLRGLRATARALLIDIADAYQLRPREESVRRQLAGALAADWANLEDVRPTKLDRYGAVDPAIVTPLGAALDQLIQIIFAMMALTRAQDEPAVVRSKTAGSR